MKIISSIQTRKLDSYTIEHQNINQKLLIERAGKALYDNLEPKNKEFCYKIFAGKGNNGNDAIEIYNHLINDGFGAKLYCMENFDNQIIIEKNDIIIDGIFGSGLNRKIEGKIADLIIKLNQSNCYKKISIDIPSGLKDYHIPTNDEIVFRADQTLCIQTPFVSELLLENYKYVGQIKLVDINLDSDKLESFETDYELVTNIELKKRDKFSHKGTFGHSFIIAGSYGMQGASILASRACHRIGSGLVTAHTVKNNLVIMQIASPETIISIDDDNENISSLPLTDKYSAICFGPGIAQNHKTVLALNNYIKEYSKPTVFDADALNIIAKEGFLNLLKENITILTPHPKEFERLFGKFDNTLQKIEFMQKFCKQRKIVCILKGAHTIICDSNGKIYFNFSGSPSLACAGSGDVLSGMITGLLAMGYSPIMATINGVFLHGKCGEKTKSVAIASDIIEAIKEVL